jgi:hypothetical protein
MEDMRTSSMRSTTTRVRGRTASGCGWRDRTIYLIKKIKFIFFMICFIHKENLNITYNFIYLN